MTVYAELIHQFRAVLEDRWGLRLGPLNPPATAQELRDAAKAFGVELPDSLRDLLSVANGVFAFSGFQIGVGPGLDLFAELTYWVREVEEALIRAHDKWPGPDHWRGSPPVGDIIVFGRSDYLNAVIEVGGPHHGRILVFEGTGQEGTAACWGVIGESIEAVLRWSLEIARHNQRYGDPFTVFVPNVVGRTEPMIDFRVPDSDGPDINAIRPIIARHGGTPAAFGYYDTPAPYLRPRSLKPPRPCTWP